MKWPLRMPITWISKACLILVFPFNQQSNTGPQRSRGSAFALAKNVKPTPLLIRIGRCDFAKPFRPSALFANLSQMRHDFLGADFQVLHLVEHGIENDMLCAGVDDRLNLFRALGRAAPNTHARTEIGVFVSYLEPLANSFLAARFIIVYFQINPLTIAEGLRVAFGLIEKAANHRRLTDESIGRRRTSAHPAVAVLHRALEG